MAELFQTTQQNISQHILNVYDEGELQKEATNKKFLSVRTEGSRNVRRELDFYNLDMIISVGYRINSQVATRFRIWATERLKEYIVKGFTMYDERLKDSDNSRYFEELLARIRDIRSSEKVFWRKVLDIYSTSIDYDPKATISVGFFKQVQNKMHWPHMGILQLDMFLNMTGQELLTHAGTVSHQQAIDKAYEEYEKFRLKFLEEPSEVEKHFIEADNEFKNIKEEREKG